MLKLSSSLTVSSDGSPVIRPGDILVDSSVDHGFDGKDMPGFHKPSGFVVGIMGDIRCTVEQRTDSMTAVGSID